LSEASTGTAANTDKPESKMSTLGENSSLPDTAQNKAAADGGRYAVYFAPTAGTPLARIGAQLLGRDAVSGEPVDQIQLDGVSNEDLTAATASARHYGFHATLKAPFRLCGERTKDEFIEAVDRLAYTFAPFTLPPLAVTLLGSFIALTPQKPSPAIDGVAVAAVQSLDRFRAPMDENDYRRRKPDDLSIRQRALLHRWGYPYVMEEYRFHLTLLGPIEPARRESLARSVTAVFPQETIASVPVDSVAVFHQALPDESFKFLSRHSFKV